jgi:hypothetical protein
MKDIKQRTEDKVQNILARNTSISETVIELMNLVVIPQSIEAFEAGYMRGVVEYEMKEKEKKYPNCMTYIDQKFGSNKQ